MVQACEHLPETAINADKLPSLPSVAIDVLRLTRDDDADLNELGQTIALDPVLAAKMLRLANSPSYRRGSEITTLSRACNVLGMKTVKLMALSFSLRSALPTSGDMKGFDYGLYWRRSLTTAVAARGLGRLTKSCCADEAFLSGLLARIGQLIMAETMPDSYSAVTARSPCALPAAVLESDILGFSNHDVGAAVLTKWGIPTSICEMVRLWDAVEAGGVYDDTAALCRVVLLADALATVLWEIDKGAALRRAHELGIEQFGLAHEELDRFFVSFQEEVAEAASELDVNLGNGQDHFAILEQARQHLVQVSLEAAVNHRETEVRASELEVEKDRLLTSSKTDALTGLANRAFFDTTLADIIQARLKGASENSLGLLFMDVDHFKSFNDTHGHLMGDEVLKHVAACILNAVRATDFTARYGGEEFVAILPNTTLAQLESAAERIRGSVQDETVKFHEEAVSVTISVGGACVRKVSSTDDARQLTHLADQCLYQAKERGRNRCVCRALESLHATQLFEIG